MIRRDCRLRRAATLCATAAALVVSAPALAGPDVPTAPASVVRTANATQQQAEPASGDTRAGSADRPGSGDGGSDAAASVEPKTITVKPGVTEVLPVSRSHLNRIVTPYTEPRVRTTSNAKIKVKEHVVYVASSSEAPITVYIMPGERETDALALALVPREIPPKEITLKLPGGHRVAPRARVDRGAARDWERDHPYIEAIRELFAGLAKGRVPGGFGLKQVRTGMTIPSCTPAQGADLKYEFAGIGQRVTGGSLIATVGRVTNTDNEKIELDERWCDGAGVVAVAYWPRLMLKPGEQAEVFVARQRSSKPAAPQRPSLLEP